MRKSVQIAQTDEPSQNNSKLESSSSSQAQILSSPELGIWLQKEQVSLVFTTYRANRLFLVGSQSDGQIVVTERFFDQPTALYANRTRFFLATRAHIWRFEGHTPREEASTTSSDLLYVPSVATITGNVLVHELAVASDDTVLFVNTRFNCLAQLRSGYSFEPVWQPPFVSQLVGEPRCFLSGMALIEGKPAYVTAYGATDQSDGWREEQVTGGLVIQVSSNERVASGLSLPHSPRWHQGRLWLLNAGTGELGALNGDRFEPLAFCPGFVRGLAIWGNVAVVGVSKLNPTEFSGLPVEWRLSSQGQVSHCGLLLVDLNTGEILHWLHLNGAVDTVFDVTMIPKVTRPKMVSLASADLENLFTIPEDTRLVGDSLSGASSGLQT